MKKPRIRTGAAPAGEASAGRVVKGVSSRSSPS